MAQLLSPVCRMWHALSAALDFSLLDRACAFFATASPHHPADHESAEYAALKALTDRFAWSPREDGLAFGLTDEKRASTEEMKGGRGSFGTRERYLRAVGITTVLGIVRGWPFA